MYQLSAIAASVVILLGLASSASAQVTLFVTPRDEGGAILVPGAPLIPGTQIFIDIAARQDGSGLAGLGVSAVGYDANGLSFSSGTGVPQLFADICIPGSGCFGGLDAANDVRDSLSEVTFFGAPEVQIFNHISLTPATATGEADWGQNGIPGEPQARVIFDVVGLGFFQQSATIAIGSFAAFGDAVVLPDGGTGTAETIWVVPEPATAMLVGLGLAALSLNRRRA